MNFLGRYTSIIVTTIIFLVLVIGVLGTNFYLSFQTEANAEIVNIAGRQRMLSQRIAKSLGNVSSRYRSSQEYDKQLTELSAARQLFNTTLLAFKNGGTTQSTKSGSAQLPAASGLAGVTAVENALSLWSPLNSSISEISASLKERASRSGTLAKSNLQSSDPERSILDNPNLESSELDSQLVAAQAYADDHINAILSLMNDLTNHSESIANDAANQSRLIQTLGILASLLCFAVIMYLIFGQLRVADLARQRARQETEQIFETVGQGLFLIDQDGAMGSQQSKALESIFGVRLEAGRRFSDFITPLVSADDLSKVERYLKLLFDPHKKQRLLVDLNPLNKLPIQIEERGQTKSKYLNFAFNRVSREGEIVGVLTSVADITKEIKLERELEAETARNEQQLEMVKVLLSADGDLLPDFLKNSNDTYEHINDILKDPARTNLAFKNKAAAILALIHKIKGESAAMGLNFISNLCHQFESEIENLENKTSISGDDFITLTIMLERLISTNEQIDSVFDVVNTNASLADAGNRAMVETADTHSSLTELAQSIAGRQGKKVFLSLAGFENPNLPSSARLNTVSMASQLLRNALSHGIEKPAARSMRGKNEEGKITLALFEENNNGYKLVCEDDGNGFDFNTLSEKAVASGLVTEIQRKRLKPSGLLNIMLNNSLSSKSDADQDAGRGVGLKVINDLAKALGGKVALQTKPREGSRFIVRFNNTLETKLADNPEEATCA